MHFSIKQTLEILLCVCVYFTHKSVRVKAETRVQSVRLCLQYSHFLVAFHLCKFLLGSALHSAPLWATQEPKAVWVMSLSWLAPRAGVNHGGRERFASPADSH